MMATTSLSPLLQALAARIEALTPTTSIAGEADDAYHVAIGTRHAWTGSRAILLTGDPGVRARQSASCSDWLVDVTIEAFYIDTAPESAASGAYLRACEDADQIAAELYAWATSAAGQALGLLSVEPQPAVIGPGEGELACQRVVRIRYRGA